jgi:DNA-directed RNA polymerase beta' subunit
MTSIIPQLGYNRNISTIKGIQFTLMSPEEIKSRAVVEVVSTQTYSVTEPILGGIFDARMGVIEQNKVCKTCKQKHNLCPGHFGCITLARPVFQIHFFRTVEKILKCICLNCSKLLVSGEDLYAKRVINKRMKNQKRFENIARSLSKITSKNGKECVHCKSKIPKKITRNPAGYMEVLWDEDNKINMYADEVLPVLKRITDEDAELLGFHSKYNRPEWLICSVLPFPPPSVRPSVRYDTGQRLEDDITTQLSYILKHNNAFKTKIAKGASAKQLEGAYQMLQYQVNVLADNDTQHLLQQKQRNGRPFKMIIQRLKTKEGRVRGNLMGKRVDFSARSVITPDPNISIDEVGIPYKVAMNLTFPEVVNKYNFVRLKEFVKNGPYKYPGAKFVKSVKTGLTKLLRDNNKGNIEINYGDVVHRHMMDGNIVLFNRQPSLHKMSMMAHKARIMDGNTFRLNVCVTAPYNADFDFFKMVENRKREKRVTS